MGALQQVLVPDIGDFKDVQVIEVLVKPGDSVEPEQSLVSLESDKATMDIPSPAAGVVRELRVKVGDKVSEGTPILALETMDTAAAPAPAAAPAAVPEPSPSLAKRVAEEPSVPQAGKEEPKAPSPPSSSAAKREAPELRAPPVPMSPATEPAGSKPHASPSVRKFARELSVDLTKVTGTGPRNRILQSDVQTYVKAVISRGAIATGPSLEAGVGPLNFPPWPKVDFAKFGPIELEPLSRIQKISGPALHRNWVMIPHVTNNDEADITELEALRVRLNKEHEKNGVKVTMLAFLIKVCVGALKTLPRLNSSLDGDHLVLKRYYHIGFAADTPNGLVVPVVKDADRKGILDIARETAELSRQAREGKLKAADMQGGTFSISSLGGIGGTSFSPIINAPEVAILGISRAVTRPVWKSGAFVPRLMLPLSLTFDHRVIDGAAAARFNAYVAQLLADFRRVTL
jgi:pyruvate dehydrogenase E2 component (dihydrolipoamide acetyltransferase)